MLDPDDPEAKRQSVENKVLLVAFLDTKGIVHHEYLPAGQTVIKEMYLGILRHLREAIRKKGQKNGLIFFGEKRGTNPISTTLFPDIAPNDFLLFPKLKAVLKGRHFDNRDDILENSLLALKCIPKEANKNCFDNREKRWRWWIKKGRITLKKWQAIYSSRLIRASLVANLIKVLNRAPYIRLCWVRGHTGINGNELADCAAKIAATSVLPHSYSTLP
ncbi:hypothetical protein LAZ67_4001367 [Cordylochernes scorpioides]|uniref:RNase H type-1 domain-containing protein n=1 Tax=Cordylochernes scorpioides TaxID=51811 RepID=A0ABY6KBW4_9ARAC|nr:hypothetical protein LAZ67_4001367 [Cordylochernes scorpioides]